jgi:transcription elongation factor Elf1
MSCPICGHDRANIAMLHDGKYTIVTIVCSNCGFGIVNEKMKKSEAFKLFKAGFHLD